LLEAGRVSLPLHTSQRMDERHLTAPQIETAARWPARAAMAARGATARPGKAWS
jgi:hypothetical protein